MNQRMAKRGRGSGWRRGLRWLTSTVILASVWGVAAGEDGGRPSVPLPAVIETPEPARDGSHPIDAPLALLRRCERSFAAVRDYTATFVKQERIGKELTPPTYLALKIREQPFSVYVKYLQPEAGKEAIYVDGENEGKIVMHTTGIARALTGKLRVDPDGHLARKGNRHSIREIGIGHLIRRLIADWEYDRQFQETEVRIDHVFVHEQRERQTVDKRPCFLITTVHPGPADGKFEFHTAKIYVDKELELPIRVEAFGYPDQPGRQPGDLIESYTYLNVRLNVGLTAKDFSWQNPDYNYSRF